MEEVEQGLVDRWSDVIDVYSPDPAPERERLRQRLASVKPSDVAAGTGLSERQVWRYRAGTSTPSPRARKRLAAYLGSG